MSLKSISALLFILVMTFALLPIKQIGSLFDTQTWAEEMTCGDDCETECSSIIANHSQYFDVYVGTSTYQLYSNPFIPFNAELPQRLAGKILVPPPDFFSAI